ncbi:hypothetical protein, variant [Puccinia triticina 1-1 BBBD Race 1]|uniref:DUF7143 domain-containing protein n=1 Tax=Puccinia triticina (isolate 1-1 / race 1 (BBBD)) TaxID=630390 RepID=A0A180GU23_PUCT1|nr:hypothetical protein, variant [Puccinia triticina 1-1 BBBD Race 1]WAR53652.1 hypothetical protein PtB15_3B160 [Puccinia triticina]
MIPSIAGRPRIPRSLLLKAKFHFIVLFICASFNIPKTISTELLKNPSIFSTYNSSSFNFKSSNKSRIPCFISDVIGSNNSNGNSLYWKEKKQPIPGIPDLELNGVTYSSIDFQSSLDNKSSVGFAIDKFIFQLEHKVALEKGSGTGGSSQFEPGENLTDEEEHIRQGERRKQMAKDEVLLLTTYWKIYGAMDIALRVLSNQSAAKILSLSKGPGFVLNFQRARLGGKVREIEFYLTQILRNCLNCTVIDRKRLILLARASGVTNRTLSATETVNSTEKTEHHLTLTSGSGQSQRLLKVYCRTQAYFILAFILLFSMTSLIR